MPGSQHLAPIGPALAFASQDFVKQEAYWQDGARGRTRFSAEILAATVAAIDFFLVALAATAAFILYFEFIGGSAGEPTPYILATIFAATLFVVGFERLGGYQLKQLLRADWQATRILAVWGITWLTLLLTAFLGKASESYSRGWVVAWLTCAPALLLTARAILRLAVNRWAQAGHLVRNIVIIGAGNEGQRLIEKLRQSQDKTIAIRGIFDDYEPRPGGSALGLNVLGTTDDLVRLARRVSIDEVLVALPLEAEEQLKQLFWKLKGIATDLRLSIEPIAERFEVRGMSYVGSVPVLEIADRPLKHWRELAKWTEDKLLSALLLIFLGPLMVIAALLIKVDSPGPVFFVQERFGFNNNVIRVLKFRTMYVDHSDQSGAGAP